MLVIVLAAKSLFCNTTGIVFVPDVHIEPREPGTVIGVQRIKAVLHLIRNVLNQYILKTFIQIRLVVVPKHTIY